MFSGVVPAVTGGQRVRENASELGSCVCRRLSRYHQKGGKKLLCFYLSGLIYIIRHVSSGREHEGDGERHVGEYIGRGGI